MSYDLWLEIDTGGEFNARVFDIGSITWNVGPMFAVSFRAVGIEEMIDPDRFGIHALRGRIAGELLPKLEAAVQWLKNHREEMEKLNPSNGWGNYEDALRYVETMVEGCSEHPKATFGLWT